jgi:hypothetical protein
MANAQLVPGTLVPYFDVRAAGGDTIETRLVTIAASQTIRPGHALVKTSGANTYENALANPSANSTTAQSGDLEVVGFALESITTNASGLDVDQGNKTSIQIAIFNQSNNFFLPGYNATPASAQPQDFADGTAYELVRVRSTTESIGAYYLNTVTTDGDCRKVGKYAGSAVTDAYGVNVFIKDSIAV